MNEKKVLSEEDIQKHMKQLDELMKQFKVNCERTLKEYLEKPNPHISDSVMNPNSFWLARFIIAFEGGEWGKFFVGEINRDFARFVGWMEYL